MASKIAQDLHSAETALPPYMPCYLRQALLAAALWLACCTHNLQAQFADQNSRFRGYPVLGLNLSQVDGDNHVGFTKIGLQGGAGVFVMLDRNSRVSLSLEILYNQKGARTNPGRKPVERLTLHYVDVPLQFSYHDRDRMIFSAGLAYGNQFGSSGQIEGLTSGNFNNPELSFLVTGTFLVRQHIGIGLRYSGTLGNLGEPVNPVAEGLIHRAVTLRTSYIF
jgi:hypothetical protein